MQFLGQRISRQYRLQKTLSIWVMTVKEIKLVTFMDTAILWSFMLTTWQLFTNGKTRETNGKLAEEKTQFLSPRNDLEIFASDLWDTMA